MTWCRHWVWNWLPEWPSPLKRKSVWLILHLGDNYLLSLQNPFSSQLLKRRDQQLHIWPINRNINLIIRDLYKLIQFMAPSVWPQNVILSLDVFRWNSLPHYKSSRTSDGIFFLAYQNISANSGYGVLIPWDPINPQIVPGARLLSNFRLKS